MRVDKPVGSFLLFWPTAWGLFLASDGKPTLKMIIVFTIGVFLTRSLGCVINDITDRKIDGFIWRTKTRPLASGALSLQEAWLVAFILAIFSFSLLLFLNNLALYCVLVAALLMLIYPWMKRITYWPQFFLSLAFNFGIIVAYAAVKEQIPIEALILFLICALWTMVYDTIYAMSDREDDLQIGVKSTAILFGKQDVKIITIGHALIAVCWVLFAINYKFNNFFYLGWSLAIINAICQIWLIKSRDNKTCLKAFKLNNLYGIAISLGLILCV